jgi:transcriptional regulator with XRE-family HTH domain
MLQLGKTIKLIRVKNGLSQKELARILKVTKTYISLLENDRKEPSLPLIKSFSKKFSIPVWLLLWEEFDLPKKPTKTDAEIKKEVDALMPKMKTYLFEKTSKNAD